MKFEEAFDKVWDSMDANSRPTGNSMYPKLLAFMWSMLAASADKDGKIVLDDFAFISNNQEIVSIPIKDAEEKKSTKAKKSSKKDTSEEEKIKNEEETLNEPEPTEPESDTGEPTA